MQWWIEHRRDIRVFLAVSTFGVKHRGVRDAMLTVDKFCHHVICQVYKKNAPSVCMHNGEPKVQIIE